MAACESVWVHDPEARRGHWRELMPDCRELRVEVGCGKGKFTVETAQAEPDVLLIAIERVPDALVLAMESAIRLGLKNVFFVSLDAANIDQFFDVGEIDLLYINFCDPWPRSKNAKRRLTYHTLLDKYRTRDLHENGPVGIMTGYEEKFYALGTPINRCEATVVSRPEPETETVSEEEKTSETEEA